ncbi:MAG: DNA mismatch repair protein MutS [Clostridia bacterium]|nr:DNA mismatch repair protein MutS [Clostridia bacterium]
MRPHLLHPDRDFTPAEPPHAGDLVKDLGLDGLFDAMARGDAFVREAARAVFLSSLADPEAIRYRQAVLRDFLAQPELLRTLYRLAVEAVEGERRSYFGLFLRSPSSVVHRSREALGWLAECLEKLRDIARAHRPGVASHGLTRLFTELERELDDEYLRAVRRLLADPALGDELLASARLGPDMRGADYVLRRPHDGRHGRWASLLARRRGVLVVRVADRDEAGHRALQELRERALNRAADALGASVDHILGFFLSLRRELAFYLACVQLAERLRGLAVPIAFPVPRPTGARGWSFQGLVDPGLALASDAPPVGNDLDSPEAQALVVTGPNRGGKSTFLRALGLAQLMMQCGMFVAARAFAAGLATGLFTHFRREEDVALEAGQLDEECRRMSDIAAGLSAGALVLMNEPFQSTNEREGSEVALQVAEALLDAGVRLACVTHLFDFADRLGTRRPGTVALLRAERLADGTRTYRILPGDPLPTSYAADLYARIFGRPLRAEPPNGEASRRDRAP